ncbi:MAG TPA: cytochrome c3 family protein [Candidatus Binataceae bacterium]|nr:cytochrome c3 family protein [Candidatus Binataceae bacterium]
MSKSDPIGRLAGRLVRWRSAAVGLALLGGGLALLASACLRYTPAVEQPIAFDHHRHVSGKNGIACTSCHETVEKETFAGIPQPDTCMSCHRIIKRMTAAKLAAKPELAKLKDFAAAGWIPWNRVYGQPDYVFFSHRRHVVIGKVECATCHGDMTSLTSPPVRPAINQSMDWCMNCHQQRQASTDCISCHK